MEDQVQTKRGRPAKDGAARTAAQRQSAFRKRKVEAEDMIGSFARNLPAELAAIEDALRHVRSEDSRPAYSALGFIKAVVANAQKFVDARG